MQTSWASQLTRAEGRFVSRSHRWKSLREPRGSSNSSYAPPVDTEVVGVTDHEVELTLHMRGTPDLESTATITLRGRAISPTCELPLSMDFGWVQTGDTVTQALSICNDTQLETKAFIGAIQSPVGEEQSFRLSEDATGSVTLPPGRCTEAVIEFSPPQAKTYVSTVEMQVSAQCPRLPVELTGRGVGQGLRWRVENREQCQHRDPDGRCQDLAIDCGAVIPNTASIERVVHFENHGTAELTLSGLSFLANEAAFSLQGAFGEDPTRLSVPSREAGNAGPGVATLTVLCRPQVIGKVGTILTGRTSSSPQGGFGIQAVVVGGGPRIATSPTSILNFGLVAHFPDAPTPTFQERRLRIRNAGMGVPGSGFLTHLRLGRANDEGAPTGPHFELIPGPNTAAGEFSISLDGDLPEHGLPADNGETMVSARVRLTPTTLGPKQARLRIFSNDPVSPVHEVQLAADVRLLPACAFMVTPETIDFGLIPNGQLRDRTFTFTNLGMETCLVSGLQLTSDSDPAFDLEASPEDAPENLEVDGGHSVRVKVRAQPVGAATEGPRTVRGSVEFYVSSPTRPQVTVALKADLGPSCLALFPNDLDFGVVEGSCSSQVHTFNIYNTCSTPVTISALTMEDGAGIPAGTADCPGGTPCPEFHLVSHDPIPSGGRALATGGAPFRFRAKYVSLDFGADIGAVGISAIENGRPVLHTVTLRGRGDSSGRTTDVFGPIPRAKADILFVVDNSSSMSQAQESLAVNFRNLIRLVKDSGADFRLAVTTTDTIDVTQQGRFQPVPGSGEKVLTRDTPDLEQKFLSLVTSLGTTGASSVQAFRSAHLALTAPLLDNENSGFLRPDSLLEIVAVSAAAEGSAPQSAQEWLGLLNGIKGRENLFTFAAVAPFAPCAVPAGDDRYGFMVDATHGLRVPICQEDWWREFVALHSVVRSYRSSYFLSSVPDLTAPGGITVTITTEDGRVKEIPATTIVNGELFTNWTYDPVGNALTLDPFFEPQPGETLSISYTQFCYGD